MKSSRDPPPERDSIRDAGPTTTIRLPAEHPGRGAPNRKQLEYWLGHFAQFDLLTDLPNRSQFLDRLHGAVARASRYHQLLGVLLLNLDHFKSFNSRYGLRTGDLILKQMGERLKGCTRASDSIARLGGDEFSVILEGLVEKDGAAIAAQRIQAALARPLSISGEDVAITVTSGVAFYPADGATVDEVLHAADVAISYAKEHARGRCEFYSADLLLTSRREQQRRAGVEQRMRRLTPREREVLDILVAGNANKMIAYMLGTSTRTIENHRARIMEKMEARSLPELVRMVIDIRGSLPGSTGE
jgi:diguanylate cyclase (GGDEF)-like protein